MSGRGCDYHPSILCPMRPPNWCQLGRPLLLDEHASTQSSTVASRCDTDTCLEHPVPFHVCMRRCVAS